MISKDKFTWMKEGCNNIIVSNFRLCWSRGKSFNSLQQSGQNGMSLKYRAFHPTTAALWRSAVWSQLQRQKKCYLYSQKKQENHVYNKRQDGNHEVESTSFFIFTKITHKHFQNVVWGKSKFSHESTKNKRNHYNWNRKYLLKICKYN